MCFTFPSAYYVLLFNFAFLTNEMMGCVKIKVLEWRCKIEMLNCKRKSDGLLG